MNLANVCINLKRAYENILDLNVEVENILNAMCVIDNFRKKPH